MTSFLACNTHPGLISIPVPVGWTVDIKTNECYIEGPGGNAVKFTLLPDGDLAPYCIRYRLHDVWTGLNTPPRQVRKGNRMITSRQLLWLVNLK